MTEYVYATLELHVLRRGPSSAKLPEIFKREGMFDHAQEMVWVVGLDAMSRVRSIIPVAHGSQYEVEVDVSSVMQAAWKGGTNRFWLVHNHPSGEVEPTKADMSLTKQVNLAAAISGAFMEDHVIIGPPDEWYSLVEHKKFTPSPAIRRLYAANGPVSLHCEGER